MLLDASDSTNREHAKAHGLWPLLRCVAAAGAAALRGGGGDFGGVVAVLVCCGGVRSLCELFLCVPCVLCVRVDGVRVCVLVVLVVLVFMGLCCVYVVGVVLVFMGRVCLYICVLSLALCVGSNNVTAINDAPVLTDVCAGRPLVPTKMSILGVTNFKHDLHNAFFWISAKASR